jgi:hypothetical protein
VFTSSGGFCAEVNRKGRRKRDPSRTKRQHTAYTLFVQENFEAIKKNNPDMPPKDIISMVAQQWSEVSGEERELWKQRAMAGTQDVSENLVHELGEDFYHGDDDDEDENKKKRAVGHNKREKETVQV